MYGYDVKIIPVGPRVLAFCAKGCESKAKIHIGASLKPAGPYSLVWEQELAISGYLRYIPSVRRESERQGRRAVIEDEEGNILVEGLFCLVPVRAVVYLDRIKSLPPGLKELQAVTALPIGLGIKSRLLQSPERRSTSIGDITISVIDSSYHFLFRGLLVATVSSNSISNPTIPITFHPNEEVEASNPLLPNLLINRRNHIQVSGVLDESEISIDRNFLWTTCGDFGVLIHLKTAKRSIGMYKGKLVWLMTDWTCSEAVWSTIGASEPDGRQKFVVSNADHGTFTFLIDISGFELRSTCGRIKSLYRGGLLFARDAYDTCAYQFVSSSTGVEVWKLLLRYSSTELTRVLLFNCEEDPDAPSALRWIKNLSNYDLNDPTPPQGLSSLDSHVLSHLKMVRAIASENAMARIALKIVKESWSSDLRSDEQVQEPLAEMERDIDKNTLFKSLAIQSWHIKPVKMLELLPERIADPLDGSENAEASSPLALKRKLPSSLESPPSKKLKKTVTS